MEKKSVKQHYTAVELLQLFADAFAPQKASRENDEQLFNESKKIKNGN